MDGKATAVRLLNEAQKHIEQGMNGMWDAGYVDGLIESALIILERGEPAAQTQDEEG